MVVGVVSGVASPGVVVSGAGSGSVVPDAEGVPVSAVAGSEADGPADPVEVGDGEDDGDDVDDSVVVGVGAVGPADAPPGWALVVARACAACCGAAPGVCWMP